MYLNKYMYMYIEKEIPTCEIDWYDLILFSLIVQIKFLADKLKYGNLSYKRELVCCIIHLSFTKFGICRELAIHTFHLLLFQKIRVISFEQNIKKNPI